MNVLKIFLATLLLGTIVSVGMITVFYSSAYSLIPRSLEVSSSTEEDFAFASVSEDRNTLTNRHKGDVDDNKPKTFSLRQLEQSRQQTVAKVQTHVPNKSKPKSNDLPKISADNKNITARQETDVKTVKTHDGTLILSAERTNNQTRSEKTDTRLGENVSKEQCKPRTDIVLLKTHKTGSSTLQNILYRFGDTRGLSFVLPPSDVYIGSPALFHPKYIVQTPGGYNILANHARFHKENMARVMPADTKYISILRYPPKQFESMYSYYTLKNRYHTSFEGFASRAQELYNKYEGSHPRHSGLNPVLYDLGLQREDLAKPEKISEYIQFIDDSFDFILIAEYLKESLILLKDLMCWSMQEIVYFSSNKRDDSLVKSIPKKTEKQLLTWHDGDYQLYLHFNRTLHRRIEEYGAQKMKNQVKLLDNMIATAADNCLQGTKKVNEMHGKTVIERYVLKPDAKDKRTCAKMTYPASDYLKLLRQKQKLKRGKKS